MSSETREFDVLIIGGGPAGLSAMMWCADLGLKAVLFEKEAELGGQLLNIHNAIGNHIGVDAANGRDLRDVFYSQIKTLGREWLAGLEIVEVDLVKKLAMSKNGNTYSGRAIFIATGVRRRKLGVPGEDDFWGRGILESGFKSREGVRGKSVVIVGGGDAAIENALILSKTADKVIVVHRRNSFSARHQFVEKATAANNITFLFDAQISAILGDQSVENIEIKHLTTGMSSHIKADAVLIRIGAEPNTDLFGGQIELDAGYIWIDATCATSLRGVFAGGDVANPVAPTISAATGHGSIAMKHIFRELSSSKKTLLSES